LSSSSAFPTRRSSDIAGWWNAGARTPLLIIQGLQDIVAPPENGHMMKKELGDRVELIDIDGAGHALLPERPEAIAKAVVTFAKRSEEHTSELQSLRHI